MPYKDPVKKRNHARAYQRAYRRTHTVYRVRQRAYNREYYMTYLRASKDRVYRLRRYGLTLEDYAKLLESQQGKCALCGREGPSNRSLNIDHDHKLGLKRDAVRGLLCFRCNKYILGRLTLEQARKIVSYLEDTPWQRLMRTSTGV